MLPLLKVVHSEPFDPSWASTFTYFGKKVQEGFLLRYGKVEVTSSDKLDFSTVTGDKLSWLMMMAQEHQYKEIPADFFESLSLAERFLYEMFR